MLPNSKKAKKLLLQFVPMFTTFWLKCPGLVGSHGDRNLAQTARAQISNIVSGWQCHHIRLTIHRSRVAQWKQTNPENFFKQNQNLRHVGIFIFKCKE